MCKNAQLLFFCVCRRCYFTSESTNRKSDYMKEISGSYKLACLQCSFSDKEVAEFIQFKKRRSQPIHLKYAVLMWVCSQMGLGCLEIVLTFHQKGNPSLSNNLNTCGLGAYIVVKVLHYSVINAIYHCHFP